MTINSSNEKRTKFRVGASFAALTPTEPRQDKGTLSGGRKHDGEGIDGLEMQRRGLKKAAWGSIDVAVAAE